MAQSDFGHCSECGRELTLGEATERRPHSQTEIDLSGICRRCETPFEVTVLKECPFAPGCFCVGDECMAWSSKSKRCLLVPREDGDA